MALGGTMKANPNLLNTLQELNDLVKFLSGNNLDKVISDIQKETAVLEKAKSDLDKSRMDNERSILALKKMNEEHQDKILILKKERELMTQAKEDNEKQLQKIKSANDSLASTQKSIDEKIAISNQKMLEISANKKEVADKQALADGLIKEYEAKLEAFRKLTSG